MPRKKKKKLSLGERKLEEGKRRRAEAQRPEQERRLEEAAKRREKEGIPRHVPTEFLDLLSPERKAEIMEREGILPPKEQRLVREQRTREKAGKEFLEEKGFFEERLPERTELDIKRTGAEKLPLVGPGLGAVREVLAVQDVIEGVPVKKKWFGLTSKQQEEMTTLIQNPQTAREIALQEIQKEVIGEGTSEAEKMGALIESIPVIGSLARKYVSGLIEDPRGNVQTIVTQIASERERASVLAEKAMTGKLGDPFIAMEQLDEMDKNIHRLEMRIHLLSLESAQLRADADTLNLIEEQILRAKERVFIAKGLAAGGIVAPASDANIYLTLKELKEGK